MRNGRYKLLSILIVVLGFAAVTFVSSYVEKNRVKLSSAYEDQDLAIDGEQLKGYVLGAEGLIADWYWMMSLQYLGDKLARSETGLNNVEDLRPLNPRLLYPYLDNATDLDPKFLAAYSYGAIVLPAIDPEKAIAFTEKGIANNPDQWRLYQHLGYIYWRLENYEKAAEAYERGLKIDGAPEFLKMMSAAMLNQGGSRDTARNIYTQMLAEASDLQSRLNAEMRLRILDSLDERDAIDKALQDFKERNRRCALSLNEAFPFLRNAKPANGKSLRVDAKGSLVDPTGVPYLLDRAECRAKVSPESKIPKS